MSADKLCLPSVFRLLASVGFSLLWAVIIEAKTRKPSVQFSVAAGLLCFHIAALEHNAQTWREVAQQSQQVCRSFGRDIAEIPGTVAVTGVPSMYRGVYFLSHGFPECIQQNSGVPAQKIKMADEEAGLPPQAQQFTWNPTALAFQKAAKH